MEPSLLVRIRIMTYYHSSVVFFASLSVSPKVLLLVSALYMLPRFSLLLSSVVILLLWGKMFLIPISTPRFGCA